MGHGHELDTKGISVNNMPEYLKETYMEHITEEIEISTIDEYNRRFPHLKKDATIFICEAWMYSVQDNKIYAADEFYDGCAIYTERLIELIKFLRNVSNDTITFEGTIGYKCEYGHRGEFYGEGKKLMARSFRDGVDIIDFEDTADGVC